MALDIHLFFPLTCSGLLTKFLCLQGGGLEEIGNAFLAVNDLYFAFCHFTMFRQPALSPLVLLSCTNTIVTNVELWDYILLLYPLVGHGVCDTLGK